MQFLTSRTSIGLIAAVLLTGSLILFMNRKQYGEVSHKAYAIATALYSTCDQEDNQRLKILQQHIEQETTSGGISFQENRWLTEIAESASDGKWQAAMTSARLMLAEQVVQ